MGFYTLSTLSYELRVHRAGSQLKKSIAIFGYKQWLLSLDMKTKVVQHVPRINISTWNKLETWQVPSACLTTPSAIPWQSLCLQLLAIHASFFQYIATFPPPTSHMTRKFSSPQREIAATWGRTEIGFIPSLSSPGQSPILPWY